MLRGEQAIMGLKTYEKKATQNKHVKAETKQTRIQGFWVTTPHTLEQVCVCMNSACVYRLDHAYTDPYLENLETQKQSRTLNQQTNNLRTKRKELKG